MYGLARSFGIGSELNWLTTTPEGGADRRDNVCVIADRRRCGSTLPVEKRRQRIQVIVLDTVEIVRWRRMRRHRTNDGYCFQNRSRKYIFTYNRSDCITTTLSPAPGRLAHQPPAHPLSGLARLLADCSCRQRSGGIAARRRGGCAYRQPSMTIRPARGSARIVNRLLRPAPEVRSRDTWMNWNGTAITDTAAGAETAIDTEH